MLIQKANGSKEEFSEKKLLTSIKRAGIPETMQTQVLMHVKSKLYENIPTSEIYHHIVEFLGKSPRAFSVARYSLKQAIMALGPTGYPFEDYLAKLLEKEGYSTKTRVITKGKCISHEIDVIATKDKKTIMVEAKYHNGPGIKTDVHVGLYTWARFEDCKEKNGFTTPWLITNTKETEDVIAYALCVGMQVMSWSYPENGSLRDLVEKYHLYPITTLTTLSSSHHQQLLSAGITLCSDIVQNPTAVDILSLPEDKKQQILQEAKSVCMNV